MRKLNICIPANAPNQVCVSASWNSTFNIVGGSTNAASSAANRLYIPSDLAIDGNGNMFVVDTGNNRVQRFPRGI